MPDDILRNKWCLRKEALLRLLDDGLRTGEFEEKQVKVEKEGAESFIFLTSLPLRSSISEKIFYEILKVRDSVGRTDVFINIWNDENKYACVYENDRVVRWGAWAVELMQTLPTLMAGLSRQTADELVQSAVASMHGDSQNDGFSVAEMELALNWEEENGNTDNIYSKDRSGMLLDFLE